MVFGETCKIYFITLLQKPKDLVSASLLLTPQLAFTAAGTSNALEDDIYPLPRCKSLTEYS